MEKSLITSCNRNVSRKLRVQLITSAAAIALSASSAIAQDNPAADNNETVVVTGSRISAPGFESPTPVVALNSNSLQRLANTSVSNLEYAIPQLVPYGSVIGTKYALNLRNLGATRTLVLMDGMRVMPNDPSNNTVDADLLPALLISNVSVVTGGASAAYGSDAVAGVVNLTLDNKFDGFKATVQAGETEYADYQNLDVAAAYGTSFGPGDKGHVVVSADYFVNAGTKSELTRPWDKDNWALLSNPTGVLPHNYFASHVTLSTENAAGVIDNGPLKGTTFAPDGTPIYNNYYGTQVGSLFMVGGNGGDYAAQASFYPYQDHQTAYSRASYDFDEHLNVFAEVMLGRGRYDYGLIPNFFPGNLTVSINNAFLPGAIKSTMIADNITTFTMGRMNSDFGPNAGFDMFRPIYNNYHTAVGGNGLIAGTWTWKAFAQFNSTTYRYRYDDDMIVANFNNSVNSQINPATGNPVCISTLTNPNNGCVPINLFGLGAPSVAAINYSSTTDTMYLVETEVDTAVDVQGQPFDTWAGPVSVATGFEWRREGEGGIDDPINRALGYYNNQPVIRGGYSVTEGYLEAGIPLAKDMPFARDLELDLVGRLTDYSTSGLTETWKVGLNYTPVDEFRLRATVSHDIRAPNLSELFRPMSYGLQTVLDPTNGQQNSAQPISGGNANLLPEQANDVTAGVIYSPEWAPGLQMSVDYYRNSIHQAIATLSPQQVVNDCYTLHQTQFCPLITRSTTTGLIQFITTTFQNLNQLQTEGFDLEASYGFTGSDLWTELPGNFNVHMTGTFVGSLITVSQGVTFQYAGMNGVNGTTNPGTPHWRMNFDFVWDWDAFTTQAYVRYVGDGLFNSQYVTGVDISAAEAMLPSATYLDLSETYQLNPQIQLYAKIANVFDLAPPLNPTNILRPLASGSPYYDVLGRDFSIAVRIKT